MQAERRQDREEEAQAARVAALRRYHALSAHRAEGWAPGPLQVDWSAQPNPFRRFIGAPEAVLPPFQAEDAPPYADLFRPGAVPAAPPGPEALSLLLGLSLGISGWKSEGGARWSLRCNPSSGNLHPVEAYVLAGGVPGLADGLFHYSVETHTLERRCFATFARPGLWVGLTSIAWREAWKYGLRAFRYCQLDLGHAQAALGVAAAALGWTMAPVGGPGARLAGLLGTDRAGDFLGAEPEEPEALFQLQAGTAEPPAWPSLAPQDWRGLATRCSAAPPVPWPEMDAAMAATRDAPPPAEPGGSPTGPRGAMASAPPDSAPTAPLDAMAAASLGAPPSATPGSLPTATPGSRPTAPPGTSSAAPPDPMASTPSGLAPSTPPGATASAAPGAPLPQPHAPPPAPPHALPRLPGPATAAEVILRRRSARRFTSKAPPGAALLLQILRAALPQGGPLAQGFAGPHALRLALAVHKVEGLAPGLYALGGDDAAIRRAFHPDFDWRPVAGADPALGLALLRAGDQRARLRRIACGQGVAAEGAATAIMLADLRDPASYRLAHRQAGAVGQALYLEAAHLGLGATGIGCFLDEPLTDLLLTSGAALRPVYLFGLGVAR